MKNILIINGKKAFGHSHGRLNQTLSDLAESQLKTLGHTVQTTVVDEGYDIPTEVEKWLWADTVIYQMPGWWMGAPWIVKKYIDEVFTEGHGQIYSSDGRSRYDSDKKYGSGGLMHDKTYMLALTWNAPKEAFTDPEQLFEGVGVDGVYLPFHKAHQFCAMKPLPTYMCNDVIKDPKIDDYLVEYRNHLNRVFG